MMALPARRAVQAVLLLKTPPAAVSAACVLLVSRSAIGVDAAAVRWVHRRFTDPFVIALHATVVATLSSIVMHERFH